MLCARVSHVCHVPSAAAMVSAERLERATGRLRRMLTTTSTAAFASATDGLALTSDDADAEAVDDAGDVVDVVDGADAAAGAAGSIAAAADGVASAAGCGGAAGGNAAISKARKPQ